MGTNRSAAVRCGAPVRLAGATAALAIVTSACARGSSSAPPTAMRRAATTSASSGDGDATGFTSRRWDHVPFFDRMKRRVAAAWHPVQLVFSYDPAGRVPGPGRWTTVLAVALTADGALRQAAVLRSCGLPWLDEEARRAFAAAQPFSDPPPPLVDPATGLISFRLAFTLTRERGSGHRTELSVEP